MRKKTQRLNKHKDKHEKSGIENKIVIRNTCQNTRLFYKSDCNLDRSLIFFIRLDLDY